MHGLLVCEAEPTHSTYHPEPGLHSPIGDREDFRLAVEANAAERHGFVVVITLRNGAVLTEILGARVSARLRQFAGDYVAGHLRDRADALFRWDGVVLVALVRGRTDASDVQREVDDICSLCHHYNRANSGSDTSLALNSLRASFLPLVGASAGQVLQSIDLVAEGANCQPATM